MYGYMHICRCFDVDSYLIQIEDTRQTRDQNVADSKIPK